MKRKLAWLLATLMCVTSIPQSTLLVASAEEMSADANADTTSEADDGFVSDNTEADIEGDTEGETETWMTDPLDAFTSDSNAEELTEETEAPITFEEDQTLTEKGPLTLGESVEVSAEEVWTFTVPESGYYQITTISDDSSQQELYDTDYNYINALFVNDNSNIQQVYHLDSGISYRMEIFSSGTLCLKKFENVWDTSQPLYFSKDLSSTYIFQPSESGDYKVYTGNISNELLEWRISNPSNNNNDLDINNGNIVSLNENNTYILYIHNYDELSGAIELQKLLTVTGIQDLEIQNSSQLFSYNSFSPNDLSFQVSYDVGKTELVTGLEDKNGNTFEATVTDASGKTYPWGTKLSVGSYTLQVKPINSNVAATCNFTVRGINEIAGGNTITAEESKRFENTSSSQFVYFNYTASESGCWDLAFNRNIKQLTVENAKGEQISAKPAFGTSPSRHYQVQLNAGETAYFAADAGSNWKALRVKITKSNAIVKAELNTSLSYEQTPIVGLDNFNDIDQDDFYLKLTYADGSTSVLNGGSKDAYGNSFRICAIVNGKELDLSKHDNVLIDQTEYTIKAYLGAEEKSSMTLSCKKVDFNFLPEIKEGEVVSITTDSEDASNQLYRFIPSRDGDYYFSGSYQSIVFRQENNNWIELEGYDCYSLEKNTTYLIRLLYGQNVMICGPAEPDAAANTPNLNLDKETDFTIQNTGEKKSFLFTPAETGYYNLNTTSTSGGKIALAIYSQEIDEEGNTFYLYQDNRSEKLIKHLCKGKTYLINAWYADGTGTGTLTITSQTAITTPTALYLASSRYEENDIDLPWLITEPTIANARSFALTYYSLSIEYGNDEDAFLNLEECLQNKNGTTETFKDSYGNEYKFTLTSLDDASSRVQRFQIKIEHGNLQTVSDFILLAPDSVATITEGTDQTISFPEEDFQDVVKLYSFTPDSSSYYKISAKGTTILCPFVDVYEADTLDFVSKTEANNGYSLKQGTNYLIAVRFNKYIKETVTVSVSNIAEKEITDLDLISLPADLYAVNGLHYPEPDGSKLRITYSDGTSEDITYVPALKNEISFSSNTINSKNLEMVFKAGSHYAEKRIPMLTVTELPKLAINEVKQVTFTANNNDPFQTRAFCFTVDKDGWYTPHITEANGTENYNWLYISNLTYGGEIDNKDNSWELKAGKAYYLLVNTSGTRNISVTATATTTVCDHQYSWTITKQPTCNTPGEKVEVCKLCKHVRNTAVIPATGNHTYTTVVDKAATCGASGSQHEECTVCHDKKASTTIPATGTHTYTTIIDKAATCGASGSQHEECTVCHDKKASTTIPAAGNHTFGDYHIVTEATVFTDGSKERTCTVCGAKETEVIGKLPATIKLSKTKVTVPLKKTISGPSVTFGKGDSIQRWKSSKPSVVAVNASTGKLTGKKTGTAKVTVTLKSGKQATFTVTVKKITLTKKLKANKKSVTLKKGKSFQLKVKVTPKNSQQKVTYKSSNKKIATVSKNGKITAKKKGKAVITITSGSKKITCKVTVK